LVPLLTHPRGCWRQCGLRGVGGMGGMGGMVLLLGEGRGQRKEGARSRRAKRGLVRVRGEDSGAGEGEG